MIGIKFRLGHLQLDGLIATVERTEKENSSILDMIASLGLTKQWEECLRKVREGQQGSVGTCCLPGAGSQSEMSKTASTDGSESSAACAAKAACEKGEDPSAALHAFPLHVPLPPPAGSPTPASSQLARSDQALLSSVTSAQTHFIITDPTLPDNPIVFASSGFYALSGYTPQEILGHNCRFMQGQHTNPATVKRLSAAIAAGQDCRCVILNYSKAGVPFWNDLFCAALRDDGGNIVHFVGVQSNIAEARAKVMLQLLAETDGVITSDASHAHEKGTKAATCDPAVATSPGHLP